MELSVVDKFHIHFIDETVAAKSVLNPEDIPISFEDYFSNALKTDWYDLKDSFDNNLTSKIIEELLRFLYLLSENLLETTVCPSRAVHSAWQKLLLNPTLNHRIWDVMNIIRGRKDPDSVTELSEHIVLFSDTLKHTELYRDTLVKYKETFHQTPPSQFWPDSDHHWGLKNGSLDGLKSPRSIAQVDCAVQTSVAPIALFLPSDDIIQVNVSLPFGRTHQSLTVDLTCDTVHSLKQRISAMTGASPLDLTLYLNGVQMSESPPHSQRTPLCSHCHSQQLTSHCTIHVFYSLDNVQSYVNKNYFTKVVKLRAARITHPQSHIHPTVSPTSDRIVRKPTTVVDPFNMQTLRAINKWVKKKAKEV